jgi:Arginase family
VKGILQTLVRHREIAGVDLVEVNPALDMQGATSLIAADLIRGMAENWSHQRALREPNKSEAVRRPSQTDAAAAEGAEHVHLKPA